MLEALEDAGATVLGPVSSVTEALSLLDGAPDVNSAILDINLNGEMVYPVADALTARGIPFIFATGYDEAAVPTAWRHVMRCEKPVNAAAVTRALHAGHDAQ
ncbi:response regulator [Sphingomonas sp.]|uniref:response regulator n=1 Tax=Sphingomonas sp. TaxID=28214 RepID=UPI003CC64423